MLPQSNPKRSGKINSHPIKKDQKHPKTNEEGKIVIKQEETMFEMITLNQWGR